MDVITSQFRLRHYRAMNHTLLSILLLCYLCYLLFFLLMSAFQNYSYPSIQLLSSQNQHSDKQRSITGFAKHNSFLK